MRSLSGFKLAIIGLVLFVALSAGLLWLYNYLNESDTGPAGTPRPKAITTSTAPAPVSVPAPSSGPKKPLLNTGDDPTSPRTASSASPKSGGVTGGTASSLGSASAGPPLRPPSGEIPRPIPTDPNEGRPTTQFTLPPDKGLIIPQSPTDSTNTGYIPVPPSITQIQPPQKGGPDGSGSVKTVKVTRPDRYLFNNMSPSALSSGKFAVTSTSGDADINVDTFSPQGEDIEVVLMDNIAGNNFEVPVNAAVWFEFYFQRNLLLPIGTKLIGTAAAGKTRNRLLVRFNRVIFKDGRSLPINAIALAPDGTVGIPGQLVGNVLLDTLGPTLLEAAANVARVLQDRTTNQNSFGFVNQTIDASLKNAGLEAVASITDRIQALIEQDLEENKPFVFLPAGTRFRVRLQAPLDTSIAEYAR
jgi:type IV secretion system protein VirB10